jgi:putative salt-induced outer membrane protein YdiY
VLKNGDSITGSIVKKDGDKVTLKSEFLGEVSMPWSAVKSVRSDEPLTVILPTGESVSGKISTSGENLEVATAGAAKSAPLAGITTVRNAAEQRSWERLQHPGLGELWTGFFDMGLALTRGNARADTFTTAFNATRVTRKDKIMVSFSQIHGTARLNNTTDTIASALRGGWTYNRDLTPRFFVTTLNTYEHDRFQNLDLRFVLGGGFGVNAVKTDRANLSFTGGGDYERENFDNNLNRNSGEANFGDDFLYKLSAATNITQSFRIFPNVTYTGEYRANFDVAAVTAVKKWLGFHLTASDRYVSNPVFGRQRNDIILATGLRLTFGK